MSQNTIKVDTTHSIEALGFRDKLAAAGVFLNAATTAEATIFNVNDDDAPVQIGGTITLVYDVGSDGDYRGDLAHDFDAAIVVGLRVEVRQVLEEGAVHWEDRQKFTVVR